MMKYFMAASDMGFFIFLVLFIRRLQKDRVFISRATHTISQEFLSKTMTELDNRVKIMMGIVTISIS
jgi:hypothetical protein